MAKEKDKESGRHLVPYSSSSDDEGCVPPTKKQCVGDSDSFSKLFAPWDFSSSSDDSDDGSDFEKKWRKHTEKYKGKVFLDSDSDGPDAYTDEDDDDNYPNDHELLKAVQLRSQATEGRNIREVYQISVECGPGSREKSLCLKFLKEIGCEDRFLCCSVSMPSVFFASLNKDEASRLEDITGVLYVAPRKDCVFDI